MTLRDQLIRDEDRRLKPYRDSVGKLTIGVGRNLDDVGISAAESDVLLDNDIRDKTNDLLTHLPWAEFLDEARRGVLLNMTFNMGIGSATQKTGLLGFPLFLAAVQQHDWVRAKNEMLNSKWARQVGQRAVRLAEQMLTGVWH